MDERLHDCVNYITPLRFFFTPCFLQGVLQLICNRKPQATFYLK